MNRNDCLIHYRFPSSSFLLFTLLREGKKCKEWPGTGKKITFQVCSGWLWFSTKPQLIYIKLLFLILGTKEEKKHMPHLKVKGGEACWPVCLLASGQRGAGAMWIRREGREKKPRKTGQK